MTDDVEAQIDTHNCELSDRDIARTTGFLRAVWKLGACRICGNAHYELAAIIVQRAVDSMDTLSDPNAYRQPTASVTCRACGETRFLDLSVARIVPSPPARSPGPRERGPSGGPFR
jgi:predicted nucleic-acid-binding Zn-ribbon protein